MACANLACIGDNGCVDSLTTGDTGQLLAVNASGEPEWQDFSDAVGISASAGNSLVQNVDGLYVPPPVSTDANNRIVTGSDGGAYLSCTSIQQCATPAIQNIAGAPNATAGTPVMRQSPTTGTMFYRDHLGAILTFNEISDCEDVQDCVGAMVSAATGLTYNDAANTLGVAISTDDENEIIFSTDGIYAPETMVVRDEGFFNANYPGPFAGSGGGPPNSYPMLPAANFVINNPSTTRPMTVYLSGSASLYGRFINTAPGGTFNENTVYAITVNGASMGANSGSTEQNSTNNNSPEFGHTLTQGRSFVIAAGGSATVQLALNLQVYNGTVGNVPIARSSYAWIGVVA